MENETMEVATSLGAVGGGAAAGTLAGLVAGPVGGVIGALVGAVAGAVAGRWIARIAASPRTARRLSLSELLEVATRGDSEGKAK
jgi:outer membrane lipoprotein SlyB